MVTFLIACRRARQDVSFHWSKRNRLVQVYYYLGRGLPRKRRMQNFEIEFYGMS